MISSFSFMKEDPQGLDRLTIFLNLSSSACNIDEKKRIIVIANIFLGIYFFLFESVIPAIINIAPQIW